MKPPNAARLFLFGAAQTVELFCRSLFVRRYGALFAPDGARLAAAAGIGLILTAVYLRTGQFLFCVLLHLAALLTFWLLAPGLSSH